MQYQVQNKIRINNELKATVRNLQQMGASVVNKKQINKPSDSFILSSFISHTQEFVSRLNANINYKDFNTLSITELKNNQVFQLQIPCASSNVQQVSISRRTTRSVCRESKKSKAKIGLTCKKQKTINKKKYIVKKLFATYQNYQIISQMLHKSGLTNNKLHPTVSNKNLIDFVGYQKDSIGGFMCGDNFQFTFFFEFFGQYTLQNQMNLRASQLLAKTKRIQSNQNFNLLQQYSFKLNQILSITKFLLETAQQLNSYSVLTNNQSIGYPVISLSDIIILQDMCQKKSFKYRNPIESIYFFNRQTMGKKHLNNFQFSNLSANRSTLLNLNQQSSQASNMICKIGICILSLCLLEDCHQLCCNSAGDLCISVVEKKIEEVFELYCMENDQRIVRMLCNMIESYILQGTYEYKVDTNGGQMSIGQAKARYNKILIEERQSVLKIKPMYSPHSVSNTNYTQLLLESYESVSDGSKLRKQLQNAQKSETVSTKILANANLNKKKQFMSEYFSIDSTNQMKPVKSQSTNKIKANQQNKQRNTNALSNKATTFRYSCNRKDKEFKGDKVDWNINPSSQKKIQNVNMLQPRTREWITQQQKTNRNQINEGQNIKQKKQTGCKRKKHQHFKSFDEIDQRWRQNQQLFKNMPEFQQHPQVLFEIEGSSSIRLSDDLISYRQSSNNLCTNS